MKEVLYFDVTHSLSDLLYFFNFRVSQASVNHPKEQGRAGEGADEDPLLPDPELDSLREDVTVPGRPHTKGLFFATVSRHPSGRV